METQNPSPQTGGLKLMTVFIVVLALHVAVIGGISAWHLFKGSKSSTEDLTAKDTALPDATATTDPKTSDATAANTTPQPATADASVPAAADPTLAPSAGLRPEDAAATAPADSTLATAPATPPQAMGSPVISTGKIPAVVQTTDVSTAPDTAVPTFKAGSFVYVVAKGDTLGKIAHAHGMKLAELKKMNGLKSDMLKLGQKLKVKSLGTAPETKMATAPATAAPETAAVSTAASGGSYVVAKGDTLVKIAKHFKTTPAAIMTANNLTDPKKLRIGAKLVIPGSRSEVTEMQQPIKPIQNKTAENADLVMVK